MTVSDIEKLCNYPGLPANLKNDGDAQENTDIKTDIKEENISKGTDDSDTKEKADDERYGGDEEEGGYGQDIDENKDDKPNGESDN